jgi:hypothetical protein
MNTATVTPVRRLGEWPGVGDAEGQPTAARGRGSVHLHPGEQCGPPAGHSQAHRHHQVRTSQTAIFRRKIGGMLSSQDDEQKIGTADSHDVSLDVQHAFLWHPCLSFPFQIILLFLFHFKFVIGILNSSHGTRRKFEFFNLQAPLLCFGQFCMLWKDTRKHYKASKYLFVCFTVINFDLFKSKEGIL